ncbi:MAG: type II toxin-antitoxin system VapC family toxin [Ignavibacteriales bacterium]|nr:type II toxin-antitoxin system VapC family toxin [Ignavibacteriales bacterium]
MLLTIDTSIIIAVITNESSKNKIITASLGYELIAPESLHWEIGNAFSAMLKRKRVTLEQAKEAINYYEQIAIRYVNVDLDSVLEYCSKYDIYAYDAYFIECAKKYKSSLISLDKNLILVAKDNKIKTLEIN